MGNKPHFHMWNHFFRGRTEAAVLGGMVIYVKSRHGVDPYFTSSGLDLQTGDRKYGSFEGTTLTRRSPCSRVAAPCPNPTWGTKWPGGTSASYHPT
jgi:hypothetical protein